MILNFNVTVMNLIVLAFLNLGGYEIVLIFFVILLLFGGKKIPELARGLGKGIKEFNSARASIESEIKDGMKEADRKRIDETKEVEETK
ncbi:MAG: twin-arginine translocase TatA/TatE family subunit [Saprospiraceae bacterium]